MRKTQLASALGCALLVASCDLAPAYAPPVIEIPAGYKESGSWQPAQPADSQACGPWWQEYGDPELDRLEAQVNVANPTLAATVAVYDQARAFAREAEAGLYPQIGLGGSLSQNRQSAHRPLRSSNQPTYYGANTIDAEAGFEIDIWGRVRNSVAAGKAEAQASAAGLEALRLSLQAELASDYLALRGLDSEISLLDRTVAGFRKAQALVQTRFQGDIASGVDVAQAETQLESAAAQLSDVNARRALLEHAIATLIGKPASTFSLAVSDRPVATPEIPVGVPSILLQRRPDIAAAEREVAAANKSIGVARAAFYPSLSLNLAGGVQDTGLNLVSLPNSIWSIGSTIALPLVEGGLRRAELAGAKAAFEEAGANYRATVLNAFREVEDDLALLHWLGQEAQEEEKAAATARRSVNLASTLYLDGAENYLQVVVVQTAALDAERAALELRTRGLQASVSLIRALGGGWSTAELPAKRNL